MNRTEIKINGVQYTVSGDESPEYMQKIGLYIDKKISEIAFGNERLNTSMVTVLAAINITDEYFKSTDAADNLRVQVASYAEQAAKDVAELNRIRQENEDLRRRLQGLEIEIARKEAEIAEIRRRTTI